MACRITSEDANDGFKPTCGLIDELSFRSTPDVWGYFSVKSGGGIHEYSDSQVCSNSKYLGFRDSDCKLVRFFAGVDCRISIPSSIAAAIILLNQLNKYFPTI